MSRTAFVFCAGGPARSALFRVPDGALVIAADAGVAEAERHGLHVDLLVGDLDSADPAAVARVEAGGGIVERYPADKDASDLELALAAAAVAADVGEIVVVGGDGGRLDHLVGNLLVLASDRFAHIRIDAVLGEALVHVVRRTREIHGDVGELISLFALGGPARGVTTEGLYWTLNDDELQPGSTRGLSNLFAAPTARIVVGDGVVVAVRPGREPA